MWNDDERKDLANDPRNLLVIDDATNQPKGAKSALEWLPPNQKFHCAYTTCYLRVLIKYELSSDYQQQVRQLKRKVRYK